MHVLHLGVLLLACGNELQVLAERGHFGSYAFAKAEHRMDAALHKAFAKLQAWCNLHRVECSQHRFSWTPIRASATAFPELKAKAHNAYVITRWLYDEVCEANAPRSEVRLFWGLTTILSLLHFAHRSGSWK